MSSGFQLQGQESRKPRRWEMNFPTQPCHDFIGLQVSSRIRMQPLAADSRATIHTATGAFSGRDHLITITRTDAAP